MKLNTDYRRVMEGGMWTRGKREYRNKYHSFILTIICGVAIAVLVLCSIAFADSIDVEKLANAIFKAENSKSKPYGIMKDYCDANHVEKCRKGCIQTIEHALRDWDGKGEFIFFLADRYCPKSVDPIGNKNWKKNVSILYKKEMQNEDVK